MEKHISVLLEEAIEYLNIKEDGIYIDATLGFAGHSSQILKRAKKGFLIAFDKDKEVLKAYNIGITNGTSDTTFSPDALITREQMATMMTRALTKAGKDTSRPESAKLFADDSEFSGYAKDSIYYMSSIEIIKGVGENKFNAKGNASREQALAISIRCVKKLNK